MMFKLFHISMVHLTIISGITAFLIPPIISFFEKKLSLNVKSVLMYLYFWGMLHLTIFFKSEHNDRMYELTPFWSYYYFAQADIRWQVYMNVFLFIPFGFLIPFSSKRSFIQTLTIGLCLSVTIEALQYIFALGLCETDDVIHNTFGTIIGYWYWVGLNAFSRKFNITKRGKYK